VEKIFIVAITCYSRGVKYMYNTLTTNDGNSINIIYIHEESQQYKKDVVSLAAKGDIVIPIVLFAGIAIGWMLCNLCQEN
jgi:hypothetical protein